MACTVCMPPLEAQSWLVRFCVEVRLQKRNQAIEGLIRSRPISTKYDDVAAGSAEAHQREDAGRIECFVGARIFGGNGYLQAELADRFSEN
nr:hypothetical protein GCM10017547_04970 [Pseudarthrobacter oxydans]